MEVYSWIKVLLLVGLGGAFGSVLRYGVSTGVQTGLGLSFPLGTLLVNFAGCLLAGAVAALLAMMHDFREEFRLLLMVGVLGGFTTFSAFAWESVLLMESGSVFRGLLNVALNNVLGLLAAWAGFASVRALLL